MAGIKPTNDRLLLQVSAVHTNVQSWFPMLGTDIRSFHPTIYYLYVRLKYLFVYKIPPNYGKVVPQ